MKLAWENYLGNHPALYAWKVLRECGFKAPPICEKVVSAYLGLGIREIAKEDFKAFEDSTPASQNVLYYLKGGGAWLSVDPTATPAFGLMSRSDTSSSAWVSFTNAAMQLSPGMSSLTTCVVIWTWTPPSED
jgi:hypothetical protein